MTLAMLQQDFRDWLAGASEIAASRLGQTAAPGLSVYQNNYRSQLVACLTEAFGRVRLWLGSEAFLAAAVTHIDDHPPGGWTLDDYGADFPDTLSTLYPGDPEIAELAWLDWELAQVFAGADAAPLNRARLGETDWDHAILKFVPALRLGRLNTNAPAIWSALSNGEMPPAASILPSPSAMLIWRQAFTPSFRTIDPIEDAVIRMGLAGASFPAMCELMIGQLGVAEGTARAGAMLARWISDELLADVRVTIA